MVESHLLAIDTTSGSCSVAVSRGETVLKTKKITADKGYSEILIPLINKVLIENELNIKKLDGFLVCTGPGNYTSLRVAISTIRGLALACNKPSCGISLFDLLSTTQIKVLVLIKGPAEKIYAQNFSNGNQVNPPRLMTMNEIEKTNEFYGCKAIGYRAKEIGRLLNSKSSFESTEISFKKFIMIGREKLKTKCGRPAPLYIK